MAKRFFGEPQPHHAWQQGADSDRRLGAHLDRSLGQFAVVLHGRRVPGTRGTIDHLVVASSGVWIADAKHYSGKVELRDAGKWTETDHRLYVDGHDRTRVVDDMWWQADAVRAALRNGPYEATPIHTTAVFADSQWGVLSQPFLIRDVHVLWARKLIEMISEPGSLTPADVDAIALRLTERLPAKDE